MAAHGTQSATNCSPSNPCCCARLTEPTFSSIWASMNLMDYIQSEYVESNWMVRFLVGKPTGFVDEHDLEEAKAILRGKCWIGLQTQCKDEFQGGKKRSNKNTQKKVVDRDADEWLLLSQINALDMKLFAHAVDIFHEQYTCFFSRSSEGR